MEKVELKAQLRKETGKQALKKLREKGLVPGIVYHRGEKSISVAFVGKEISRLVSTIGGGNALIHLKIEKDEKSKARPVIIKEIQQHPVKRNILHVDLNEISLTEKIIVEVEITAKGDSIGVRQNGGVLDHTLRHVKIECLPTDLPKNIEVDISKLDLNDTIHVRDLVLSEKLKVVTDPELLLFQVKLHEEKVEEAAAETPELEVIREKKEEAPEAGQAKAKEEPKAKEAAKPEKK